MTLRKIFTEDLNIFSERRCVCIYILRLKCLAIFPLGFNHFFAVLSISRIILHVSLIRSNNNVIRWRDFAYDNEVRRSRIVPRVTCKYGNSLPWSVISFHHNLSAYRGKSRQSIETRAILPPRGIHPVWRSARALAALSRARKFALYYSQTWITHPAFQLQPITWIEWRRERGAPARDEAEEVVIVRVDIARRE